MKSTKSIKEKSSTPQAQEFYISSRNQGYFPAAFAGTEAMEQHH